MAKNVITPAEVLRLSVSSEEEVEELPPGQPKNSGKKRSLTEEK